MGSKEHKDQLNVDVKIGDGMDIAIHGENGTFYSTLCSKNFQKVKLRLDFVEIWSFYRHSDFTWNQIFANSNGPKISFLAILETQNVELW